MRKVLKRKGLRMGWRVEGRGCTEGSGTMKELGRVVSGEDEGVGGDESEKRVDRRDGFGDDCFR